MKNRGYLCIKIQKLILNIYLILIAQKDKFLNILTARKVLQMKLKLIITSIS